MNINNQKGQALVELALSLMLLLTIVFGIFEFGRAMFISNTLNNAAREGARRAAVSPAPINIDAYVTDLIWFDKTDLKVVTNLTPGPNPFVRVTVTIPFHTVVGLFPLLDGKILKGEATMRYEM